MPETHLYQHYVDIIHGYCFQAAGFSGGFYDFRKRASATAKNYFIDPKSYNRNYDIKIHVLRGSQLNI